MSWSYKTVRFDLKKEGILSSAFLDESEIEESLNEFGQAGWELVSFVEVQEGLLAVFKMPTTRFESSHQLKPAARETETVAQSISKKNNLQLTPEAVDSETIFKRDPVIKESKQIEIESQVDDQESADIGSIRIE